jgi:heptosyltransferase-2/heptosyltransferase-3
MIINLEDIGSYRGAFKMAAVFWLIGAKYKVGRDTDGLGFFLNIKVKDDSHERRHEVEANLDVARALGGQIEEIKLELPIFDEDKIFVSDFLSRHNVLNEDLVMGLNPGAFRPSHRWLPQRWAQLADQLIEGYKAKIIIIGQKRDAKMIGEIVALMKKPALIATHLTLKQLAALIKRFNLFITNDSGPMHIAAAMQTPIIALFGPSDICEFSPYCNQDKYQIVQKDIDCRRTCYNFYCQDNKCMALITAQDVLEAARRILG